MIGKKMFWEIISYIMANDLDWDFAIRDMDGAQYEYYGLSFKDCDVNGATLVLDSDGNATLN